MNISRTPKAGGDPDLRIPPNWRRLSEAGWGVNIIQQGDLIFASWFTYDATGKGMWIYGSNSSLVRRRPAASASTSASSL